MRRVWWWRCGGRGGWEWRHGRRAGRGLRRGLGQLADERGQLDLAAGHQDTDEEGREAEAEDVEESLEQLKNELKDKGGRPREGGTYKKDKNPFGRDPLGDEERKAALKKERKESKEAKLRVQSVINGVSAKKKFLHETDMLDENNIIEE